MSSSVSLSSAMSVSNDSYYRSILEHAHTASARLDKMLMPERIRGMLDCIDSSRNIQLSYAESNPELSERYRKTADIHTQRFVETMKASVPPSPFPESRAKMAELGYILPESSIEEFVKTRQMLEEQIQTFVEYVLKHPNRSPDMCIELESLGYGSSLIPQCPLSTPLVRQNTICCGFPEGGCGQGRDGGKICPCHINNYPIH